MKTALKIGIGVSVTVAVAGATAASVILTRKRGCPESCSQLCGVTCDKDPKCVGSVCEDPDATCTDGVCVTKHSCSPTGECVPDPNGPFDGPTCTCVDFNTTSSLCAVVGDTGKFASVKSCEAREADFQCIPGTGTCERVLGSTTGWKSEEECRCFECTQDLTCVPTQEINPVGGTDGVGCLECGMWKCTDGECTQSVSGGVWKTEDECGCAVCASGACEAATGGGAYKSVSACEADGAALCTEPTLGWACSESAGNPEACSQVIGGSAATLKDCRCWTCAGTPPGPSSECVLDHRNTGDYQTHEECFMNEENKCGWKYQCTLEQK